MLLVIDTAQPLTPEDVAILHDVLDRCEEVADAPEDGAVHQERLDELADEAVDEAPVTFEAVVARIDELVRDGRSDDVLRGITTLGVSRVSELAPEQYPALLASLA